MNPLIETLNRFGENTLHFAWPMLWQSSLFIAVLFVIDFALRRRVRAAVRYALWLVLLVKLLLPPSLALPTGVAWWLFPSVTTPARTQTTKFVVRYGADTAPSLPLQPAPAFTPPRPPMSIAAWTILTWSGVSLGLLVWLIARWRQVVGDVKRATPVPAWLGALFDEAKNSTGLRRSVRLRLTDQAMSPAVCGLFRPVILLPQSLVEKLPPVQLRAVLLHELTHLRRGDVWMNCAQALAQIVYWWHPLLWFANARIRRVREEAVDDSVMLVLRDDAETYAPMLLEVAKLAFQRPLASLGLVGILESRSALRQRIERLVNFHAPRKAGLTFVSLCGICIFSAVAVPMGEAPPPSTGATHVDQEESAADKAYEAAHLVQDAKVNYEMGKFDEADRLLTSALVLKPDNQAAHYYRDLVEKARHAQKSLQDTKTIHPSWDGNPTNLDDLPPRISVINGRRDIVSKLNRIRLDQVSWPDGLPLSEVLRMLSLQTKLCDPDKKGINFTFHTNAPAASAATASAGGATTINPTTGLPEATPADVAVDASSINVKLTLIDIRLADLLDAIVLVADHPIKYSILDDGVVFSTRDSNSAPLETRTFKIDPNMFFSGLQRPGAQNFVPAGSTGGDYPDGGGLAFVTITNQAANISLATRQFFTKLGLNLDPPKSLFFNDRLGVLFVHATEPDLDVVEKAVQVLNYTPPPQIHIKARFIEVPEEMTANLGANFIPTSITNVTGILTDPNFRLLVHTLEKSKETETLAEPEVVTLSGRQTQMRATEIMATVITNFVYQETPTNGAITPQSEKVELGPVLDVVPSVLPDGFTIDLKTRASVVEFLGYDKPTNTIPTVASTGVTIDVPTILPSFHIRQANAHLKLWDGQTVVLGRPQSQFLSGGKEVGARHGAKDKELLVFVTVNLVDRAGNRIHTDDEMQFAQKGIPPQDAP
jgi:beta-lactamase regulating signal transducer with metallopeptidase domain